MPLTAAPMARPGFQTTFGTLLSVLSKLPMARRHQRASTAILIVVVFFSAFTILTRSHSQPTYEHIPRGMPFTRKASLLHPVGNRPVPRATQKARSALKMDPAEELAAVIHFITAIPSNAITDVDPQTPIPPELLLGFNVRSGDQAKAELDNLIQNTWFEHPVVIFSLVHSPRAREVKKIIESYKLLPPPVVVEVDERSDVDIMTPVIQRLTGEDSFPILLIGGKPAGSLEDIRASHNSGSLRLQLAAAGAVIGGSEKKKKKKLIVQFSDE